MMKKIFMMMVMSITTLSVSAQKKATLDTLRVTTTPQMHCANCEKKIKNNIRFVKGVKKIETSVPEQKVTIVYDKVKSNYNALKESFKKIGFAIEKVGNK